MQLKQTQPANNCTDVDVVAEEAKRALEFTQSHPRSTELMEGDSYVR